MRRTLLAVVVCVAFAAGAAPGVAAGSGASEDVEAVSGLGFHTVSSPVEHGRDPTIRVGYSAQANATVFFALRDADGAFVGHTGPVETHAGSAVDGRRVPVDDLAGLRTLTVTAYVDDGDRAFDPAADRRLATNATRTFSFAGDDPALGNVAAGATPATRNVTTTYRVTVPASGPLTVSALAIDARHTGLRVDGRAASVNVSIGGNLTRAPVANVTTTGSGVVAIDLDRSYALAENDYVVVSLPGRTPGRVGSRTLSVAVNPRSPDAATDTATVDVERAVPTIEAVADTAPVPGELDVSYRAPVGAHAFFVAEQNGSRLGHSALVAPDEPIETDGGVRIDLPDGLAGETTLRVVAYNDTNGSGDFDPEADEPYARNGAVVAETATLTIGAQTTSVGDEDMGSSLIWSAAAVGVSAAFLLVGVAVAAVALRRRVVSD